jgi:hypothetical protein
MRIYVIVERYLPEVIRIVGAGFLTREKAEEFAEENCKSGFYMIGDVEVLT